MLAGLEETPGLDEKLLLLSIAFDAMSMCINTASLFCDMILKLHCIAILQFFVFRKWTLNPDWDLSE